MADARLSGRVGSFGWAAACLGAVACVPARGSSPSAPPSASGSTSFDDAHVTTLRSARLELSLPLPDAPAWTIDDRSRPALVAVHAASDSALTVAVLRTDGNVGRGQCEALARERHLVSSEPAIVLEDEIAVTQKTFDTRIEVGLDPVAPARPLVGHVLAFGGYLRKCFAFDFSTRAPDPSGEPALSARLAFARARILPGLALDTPTLGTGR